MGWAICCDRCGADGQLAQLKKPAERALGAFMQAEGCMVCDLCSFGDFTLGLQHEVAQVDAAIVRCRNRFVGIHGSANDGRPEK